MVYDKIYTWENSHAMPENLKQCKKCKAVSGNDWQQCQGRCTLEGSPHYNQATADHYGPPRELTREEYLTEVFADDVEIAIDDYADDEIPF